MVKHIIHFSKRIWMPKRKGPGDQWWMYIATLKTTPKTSDSRFRLAQQCDHHQTAIFIDNLSISSHAWKLVLLHTKVTIKKKRISAAGKKSNWRSGDWSSLKMKSSKFYKRRNSSTTTTRALYRMQIYSIRKPWLISATASKKFKLWFITLPPYVFSLIEYSKPTSPLCCVHHGKFQNEKNDTYM